MPAEETLIHRAEQLAWPEEDAAGVHVNHPRPHTWNGRGTQSSQLSLSRPRGKTLVQQRIWRMEEHSRPRLI